MLREIIRNNQVCDEDLLKQKLVQKFGPTDGRCSLGAFVNCLEDPDVGISTLDANFIGFLCRDPPGGSDVGIAKFITNMEATSPTDPYAERDHSEALIKL